MELLSVTVCPKVSSIALQDLSSFSRQDKFSRRKLDAVYNVNLICRT